jgi:hypothetical protein
VGDYVNHCRAGPSALPAPMTSSACPTDAVEREIRAVLSRPKFRTFVTPELALAAGAQVIVSGDRDRLDLDPWRGVRILAPAVYVRLVEARLAGGDDPARPAAPGT